MVSKQDRQQLVLVQLGLDLVLQANLLLLLATFRNIIIITRTRAF